MEEEVAQNSNTEQPELTWQCEIRRREDQQLAEFPGTTVGEVFDLSCQGDPVEFGGELRLEAPESLKYLIKILETKRLGPDGADFVATTYQTGPQSWEQIYLTDGTSKVRLTGAEWVTESVLPQQTETPPEPYGPIAPMKAMWPAWVFISLGIAFLVIVFWSVYKGRRWIQRRKLIQELEKHQTAAPPYHELTKDFRALNRKFVFKENQKLPEPQAREFVETLDKSFRLFLVRQFRVPAFQWDSGAVVRAVRRTNKTMKKDTIRGLRLILREMDRAVENPARVTGADCQQLLQLSGETALRIHEEKKRVRK